MNTFGAMSAIGFLLFVIYLLAKLVKQQREIIWGKKDKDHSTHS